MIRKINISENQLKLITEETVADGNSDHNLYAKK